LVEFGSRAFETLMALIDARGKVLGKDELMSRVWPDRVVEENNLPAQIAVLRQVFGADRDLIRTVAGRGYQFTGEIRATAATAAGPPPSRMTNPPEPVSELIGREAEFKEVTALATEYRLVSLVGAGGIGRTRLGLEVARHLLPRFPDVSRARAAEPRYVAEGPVAAATVAICRRLDGIPLAIELAATRIVAFGVEGVAARLDDRFRLLTGGRRTALPRHQTMRATLDWSYDLLPATERAVLRRLAIFAGGFTLDAAAAVATADGLGEPEVVDGVGNLVAKSLVSADLDGTSTRYRLLETTRAYGLAKLAKSGELDQVSRRHAGYYRDLLERAERESEARPPAKWRNRYARHLDNARAALGLGLLADRRRGDRHRPHGGRGAAVDAPLPDGRMLRAGGARDRDPRAFGAA